jgi:CrcB protein
VQNLMRSWSAGFPWGTLVVNVTGSFVIGFLVRYGAGSAGLSVELRAGLMGGFCGAYTTFSTYSYETLVLLQSGSYGRATAYAMGSVLLALGSTALGMMAAGSPG